VIAAPRLRVSELIGIAYFVYLSATAVVRPLPALRRARVWIAATIVIAVELTAGVWLAPQLRDWLPAAVILAAYFVTGAFFVAPSPQFEAWLANWDVRMLGSSRFDSVPGAAMLYLDVVYDSCFLMIPAGFAVYAWTGRGDVDRFWTLVSAAEFLSFGTLPWLQARPPWAIEGPRAADRSAMRRFSLLWVNRTSIRANTFPSGHASASLAVALALAPASPMAAAVFGALAVSIAIGSIVGRFHYAIDAIAGLLLAVVLWWSMIVVGW
jgi:membrane-associated phospholipid phosphatase